MDAAYIELNFRPNVQLVSVVRRFVADFYQRFLGADSTARVALATHELLENAVKYSRDGETTIRIEVMQQDTPHRVRIQLRNRAEPRHVQAIRELVDGIASSGDATAFYHQLLARRAKRDGASGLGLARICAEGEMQVRLAVEADVVVIEATTAVGEVRAP